MTGLPPGWEWDYDGKRWFYTYKSTGHIQFHFPKEGDEFPDFVSAGAPVPQLAPEERLESQQQVRRRTSQHQSSGGDGERWRSRMSATGGPVSDIWQDGPASGGNAKDSEREAFQPESFMYLGPGTYIDVSPLVEEEEEAARRAVAGGSPDSRTITTVAENAASPPNHTVEVHEEAHMLDGREMPHELPVEDHRFNPVGVVAEMASEMTARSRAETHPDPVEIADHSVLAPIETAVPEGIAELAERNSPVEMKEAPKGQNDSEEKSTVGVPDQGSRQRETVGEERRGQAQLEENRRSPEQDQPIKMKREPTNPSQYQAYQPVNSTEEVASTSPKSESWQPPTRRDSSHIDVSSLGDSKDPSFDPSSVPTVLALRKRSPEKTPERKSPDATPLPTDTSPPKVEEKSLGVMPSVLRPARHTQNIQSIHGHPHPQSQPLAVEAPIPTSLQVDGSTKKPLVGVAKFPSVLKPARGKTPAQPANPEITRKPNEPLPRKVYLQPDDGSQNVLASDGQRTYMSYTGRESAIAPISQVVSTENHEPVRPASVMPTMERVPQTSPPQQTTSFEVQSDVIHRPASTPAGPSSIPIQHAVIIEASPVIQPNILSSVERVSNPSEGPSIPTSPVGSSSTATTREVSPLASRSASVSSTTPENRRRGSSAVSLAQSIDSAATFTPSPDLPTPPSATQGLGSPPVVSSVLRHSVSGDRAAEAPEVISPPVPEKVPLDQGRDSYFTVEDTASNDASQSEGSLNASASSSSTPATQVTVRSGGLEEPQPQSAPSQQQEIIQSPPVQPATPGHVLSRIEEHDEEPPPEITRVQTPSMGKRHSLASSIQQSPQTGRQSPGAASVASSLSLPGREAAPRTTSTTSTPGSRPMQSGMLVQGQISQASISQGQDPQAHPSQTQVPPVHASPAHASQSHASQTQTPQTRLAQGQLIQGQPNQGQVPQTYVPSGPIPQTPPGQPQSQGPQHPASQPQRYPAPLQIPPGKQPVPGHPQQQWNTQMSPQVAPGFRPGSIPHPQSPASPAKEEKKWSKWFSKSASKLSKTSTPSQAAQPQYYTPPPGQVHQPSLQGAPGAPPLGWAAGPYSQPAVWQPGQPPQGYANAGGQRQSMPPQMVQSQQAPSAPASGFYAPPLQRTNTAGSGSTTGSIQPDNRNRISIESQHSQKSGRPLQQQAPPPASTQQPLVQQQSVQRQSMQQQPAQQQLQGQAIQQTPSAQQHRPQVHHQGPYYQLYGQPQGAASQQSPMVQRQHWPSAQPQGQVMQQNIQPTSQGYAYPVGYNVSVAVQQPPQSQYPQPGAGPVPGSQKIPATTGLPSQQSSQPPARTTSSASLMPQPLFAKPVAGQSVSQPQMDLSGHGDKWAKRPVVDYSGGGWGDEDDWNRR